MRSWLQAVGLALVFAVLGAFCASLWLEVRRETPSAVASTPGTVGGRRIRVEVLNGAGVDGLAGQATERLRELGFDVVYYGNADDFGQDTSVAIARLENMEPARRVADALQLQRVEQELDRNLYLDVTVILGADWRGAKEEATETDQDLLSKWVSRIRRALNRLWPG
ncbi:MAG: LytR C-terminal domain-containing protein [Gemmatimonadales bacterium]|jgi:hypothetical protein